MDTTRPDHFGCYGYHRNTTPNIDRIASQGVRFTNYYCSDAPCLPSRTALMTGQFGIHTGVVGHGGTAADMRLEGKERPFQTRLTKESLPGFLRQQGLHTVSISPFAERHSAWQFYAGFSEMYNTGKSGMESAEEVTPVVLDWINRNASSDDWFLHINYWDPHTPYRAPESFGNPFSKDPLPDWITDDVLQSHQKKVGPHSCRELNMYSGGDNPSYPRYPGEVNTSEDLRRFFDGYDCGIAYLDQHFGMVLDALEKVGVLDDTMIIISADHGENMGELGIYAEHGTADYCTCRIPMIIRYKGGKQNWVDEGLHYNLDLLPTFAELFNQEPSPHWDGKSYLPSLISGSDTGRPYLVLSQCCHVCQRSVRFGPWIYIKTYHDGFHLFDEEMLFDLESDPHEQHNRAQEHPEICQQAVYSLQSWHDTMMHTSASHTDPLWVVMKEGGPHHARGMLKKYVQRLEQTGRSWGINQLKDRHPQEFPDS